MSDASTTQTQQPSSGQQSQSPSGDQGSQGGSQDTQQQATAPSRPEYVPETFWDATSNSVKPEFTAHIGELAAAKAALDARAAARPEKPEGYELKFSEGFKPEVAIQFNPDDPRVKPLQAMAHEFNLSQAEFSRILEVEAQRVIAEEKQNQADHDAEMKKLGTNGSARVTALETALSGLVGNDKAKSLLGDITRAESFEALEDLQRRLSSQGGSHYNNGGREPPPPPTKPLEQKLWPKRLGANGR